MKTYTDYLEQIGEYGVVKGCHYPVLTVEGLSHAHLYEVIIAENGEMGMVFSINPKNIQILLFSEQPLAVGTKLTRSGEYISIPVGEGLVGWVMDALGRPLFGEGQHVTPLEKRFVHPPVQGIINRVQINKQLFTGVSMVDMVIPLGKGQRELVVGDRKTGKSSFILNTIKKQAQEGAVIVYAIIGRRKSEVRKLYDYCKQIDILKNMVIVSAASDVSPSLVYIAPFAAMTIAEYFRDQGRDVVVVLDDLSTHAKFYREITLIAEHFPGRESYPGDIFYIHARLLERGGNFKYGKDGSVSISCLPIVETVEGDLTGYIPTNCMGMTDGHIFFDSNLFYNGIRPAINTSLSVTRAGKQTQTTLSKDINHEISAFLSQYEKMKNYSHFGSELSNSVKDLLLKGDLLYQIFQQHYSDTIPHDVQMVVFGLIWTLAIRDKQKLLEIKDKVLQMYETNDGRALIQQIITANTVYDLLKNINLQKAALGISNSVNNPVPAANATPGPIIESSSAKKE